MKKWLKIVLLIVLVIGVIPFQNEKIMDDTYFKSILWSSWIIHSNDNNIIASAFNIPGSYDAACLLPSIQVTYKWGTNRGCNIQLRIPSWYLLHSISDGPLEILGWAEGQGFY